MTILNLETSTNICSIALSKDGMIIYDHTEKGNEKGSQASEKLGTMVDEAMKALEERRLKLDAVAVSSGPGSYTGLRIGTSMAKGIAYGSDARLIAVPTLELLCVAPLLSSVTSDLSPLLCPMLDARRMEVYAGLYDRALHPVREVRADVVDGDTYRQWLDERPVYFFGNGAGKCMEVIGHPNAHYIDGIEPQARWMQPLAERRLLSGQVEDVAYFEPFYLKDFVAKMPKKLI